MSQTSGTAKTKSGTQETPPIERLKVRSDFLRVADLAGRKRMVPEAVTVLEQQDAVRVKTIEAVIFRVDS